MNYLSLDVGTTCCKCQLFSEVGEILLYKAENYSLKVEAGETYVDVNTIQKKIMCMISYVAERFSFASICISSLGESFVLLDKQDNILFDPMLYIDPRGDEEAEEIADIFGKDKIFRITGTVPQSMYSVSKLLWIKKNRPEIFERADKVMLIGDYLGYLLTGERVIDYALAARTGVFNINDYRFEKSLLDRLGIPYTLFSKTMPAGSVVGEIGKDIAERLGLKSKCVLVLGSHDQVCAALGAGIIGAGDAVDGMGTVECITTVFENKTDDYKMGEQGYPCVPYAVPGLYCTYILNYTCGLLVSWYKNNLLHGYHEGAQNFFEYAENKMTDLPTGILTLPYFGGAATPYQNINAKGALLNLTTHTTDADIYRSIMEGTAMEMRLNIENAAAYGIFVNQLTATGGGANSKRWLRIKADIQNVPIKTLRSSEGGLCGCAMLQYVALNAEKNFDAAKKIFVKYDEIFTPDAQMNSAYGSQYKKYKKLYEVIKEFY